MKNKNVIKILLLLSASMPFAAGCSDTDFKAVDGKKEKNEGTSNQGESDATDVSDAAPPEEIEKSENDRCTPATEGASTGSVFSGGSAVSWGGDSDGGATANCGSLFPKLAKDGTCKLAYDDKKINPDFTVTIDGKVIEFENGESITPFKPGSYVMVVKSQSSSGSASCRSQVVIN